MKCMIEITAVPDTSSGHWANQPVYRSEARCKTHHMKIDEPCWSEIPGVTADYQCPIGRIEEATEKALAELRAEIDKLRDLKDADVESNTEGA